MQRTTSQNSSSHKWYKQIAEALNDAGYSQRDVLTKPLEVDWTEHAIKDLARAIGKKMYGKSSTADWDTVEHTHIVDELIRYLGQFVDVPSYPCKQNIYEEYN